MSDPNFAWFPLFTGLMVTTNGAALSPSTLGIPLPQLSRALQQSRGLCIVGLTELVAGADFEWNIGLISGFTRNNENARFNIATANFNATALGGVRSPELVDLTKLLLESRLQLWYQNAAGVNGPRTARISAVLGSRLMN